MLLRVKTMNGQAHAFWCTQAESTLLTRKGLAKTYGSRRRVHGLILLVAIAIAAAALFGCLKPAGAAPSLRAVVRERIAGKPVWSHRVPNSRQYAIARAA